MMQHPCFFAFWRLAQIMCRRTAILLLQVAYHSGDIPGVDGNYANPPVKVKENLGSVIDAIRDRFHLEA